MKPSFFLVLIGRDTFVMRNPTAKLTNRMVNSSVFPDKADSLLDVDIFEFFGLGRPLILGSKLDFRENKTKRLVKRYGYFSASFLPEISKRAQSEIYVNTKGSYHADRG